MKVTLKNLNDFDIKQVSAKVETYEDVLEIKTLKTSLTDSGLPEDFKEVSNINDISFGHFIIIEKILELDIDQEAKLRHVSPYLIRPSKEKQLDNEDQEVEQKHIEAVESLDIGIIYGVFNRYLPIRKEYLFKSYNGVIYATYDPDEQNDDDDEDDDSDKTVTAREFHTKKFFWYSLIGSVCNDDIFKRADAVELKMYEVMPFLAEKRSLQIIENLEARDRRI